MHHAADSPDVKPHAHSPDGRSRIGPLAQLAIGRSDWRRHGADRRAAASGGLRAAGRAKGSVGAWIFNRAFDAVGAEALSPAVDQGPFAAFLYEELTWPHVTVQFAGRVDHTKYEPFEEDGRDFTSGSGSVGLLLRPAAADDRLTIAVSAARAARNPALEELFYFGPHPGHFAFEIGNPHLEAEHAFGFDVSLRWRSARASGEITYFRNDIRDFVFTAPVTAEDVDGARFQAGVRRHVLASPYMARPRVRSGIAAARTRGKRIGPPRCRIDVARLQALRRTAARCARSPASRHHSWTAQRRASSRFWRTRSSESLFVFGWIDVAFDEDTS